jgi:hypothetical protein
MERTNDTIDLTEVLNQLDAIDYKTLAEKAEKQFGVWYETFFGKFGRDESGAIVDDNTKKEMAISTYTLSLEALNTGLNYLEYAYMLSLAIKEANKTYNLEYSDEITESMDITNRFVYDVASNIDLTINTSMKDFIMNLKNKGTL